MVGPILGSYSPLHTSQVSQVSQMKLQAKKSQLFTRETRMHHAVAPPPVPVIPDDSISQRVVRHRRGDLAATELSHLGIAVDAEVQRLDLGADDFEHHFVAAGERSRRYEN